MKRIPIYLLGITLNLAGMAATLPPIKTVFVIVEGNHWWVDFKGNANAPYINNLLAQCASCNNYTTTGVHPNLPNYLWLEAGTDFGISAEETPLMAHQATTNHLVTLLNNAGITWKSYQENIDGGIIPLSDVSPYFTKHNPFVYFDDITGTNDPSFSQGINHIRPYSELATDLANNTVARYNFITPNIYNDGHSSAAPINNTVRQTDIWLANEVPKILNSSAYKDGGVLLITWDDGNLTTGLDGSLGMILLSPYARPGYVNSIHYNHSSTLRTLQEIFGVTPWLGDAANATDLSDLFNQQAAGTNSLTYSCGLFPGLTINGTVGQAYSIQGSTNLADTNGWITLTTITLTNQVQIWDDNSTDTSKSSNPKKFYRVMAAPY